MLVRCCLLLLLSSQALAFSLRETTNPFGIWGRSQELMSHLGHTETYLEDMLEGSGIPGGKPIPPEIKGSPTSISGKTLVTLNKMGFDVVTGHEPNWVIKELLNDLRRKQAPVVLDVGGGYGGLTKQALEVGATVVYNDKLADHLIAGINSFPFQHFQQVYLNNFSFPDETNFAEKTFDAVVLHRVVVKLTPTEIEDGLSKVHQWLKPDGKIYMVSFAPQHKRVKESFLPQYEQAWEQGNLWPGYPLDVKTHMPDQAYALPEVIHAMDGRVMDAALKRHGFEVLKSGFVSLKHLSDNHESFDRDGRELYGVVGGKIALPTGLSARPS